MFYAYACTNENVHKKQLFNEVTSSRKPAMIQFRIEKNHVILFLQYIECILCTVWRLNACCLIRLLGHCVKMSFKLYQCNDSNLVQGVIGLAEQSSPELSRGFIRVILYTSCNCMDVAQNLLQKTNKLTQTLQPVNNTTTNHHHVKYCSKASTHSCWRFCKVPSVKSSQSASYQTNNYIFRMFIVKSWGHFNININSTASSSKPTFPTNLSEESSWAMKEMERNLKWRRSLPLCASTLKIRSESVSSFFTAALPRDLFFSGAAQRKYQTIFFSVLYFFRLMSYI